VLFDVSQTINYIPDTQELLIKILDKTIDALGADHASIMLLNEETDSLQLKMVRGIDYDRKTKVTLKKGVGIAGLVLDRGEPLLISQGEDDPRFVVFTQDRNVRSMLCVPLLQSGKPFGVLNVVIRNSQNVKEKFTRLDLRLSTSIANQIALVIDKAKLYQASITDGMTGLYINNYFKARLREEVRRSRRYGMPLALIMCDIDHFKNFNDSWGHQMGDRVLCAFAEVIRIAVRDKLDIPARYGGEEFAVICPETTAEGALVLADRIRQIIEEKEFSEGGESISVTASFGVAISDETITEMDQLIKRADDALYQSKNAGRNQVTFWENKEPPTEILAIDSDKNPEDFT
jgi:diguanylate cyclase (GGDEF)-like protein